jgi:hypothetical protein
MTRPSIRFAAILLCVLAVPLVAGCPKKEAAVADASPAPPPAPASAPTVTELAPLVEDAGEVIEAAEVHAAKRPPSGAVAPANANQTKIRQCCNAMRTQAKQLGTSPEANQMVSLAAACDSLAAQVGPQGTAPEFSQLRQMLQAVKLPNVCQF